MDRRFRPPASDAALALTLALVGQFEAWAVIEHSLAAIAALIGTVPLAWRRRFPLAAMLVIVGSLVVIGFSDVDIAEPMAPFVAIVIAMPRQRNSAGG